MAIEVFSSLHTISKLWALPFSQFTLKFNGSDLVHFCGGAVRFFDFKPSYELYTDCHMHKSEFPHEILSSVPVSNFLSTKNRQYRIFKTITQLIEVAHQKHLLRNTPSVHVHQLQRFKLRYIHLEVGNRTRRCKCCAINGFEWHFNESSTSYIMNTHHAENVCTLSKPIKHVLGYHYYIAVTVDLHYNLEIANRICLLARHPYLTNIRF